MMYCEICGGLMLGDGYREGMHCEYADYEDYKWMSPDDEPVYCKTAKE